MLTEATTAAGVRPGDWIAADREQTRFERVDAVYLRPDGVILHTRDRSVIALPHASLVHRLLHP